MRVFQASAPGRCGIIGNPSDIYGGVVVSCSVPARAMCRIMLGAGERLPEDLTLWNAVTRRFPLEDAWVEWSTSVPRSSGLAGSTALLAATLACVMAADGEPPNLGDPQGKIEFSELLRDLERNDAGVVCGYQDAYMVVHGGLQRMDFEGKELEKSGPPGTLLSLKANLPFLLITTGVQRLSGSVHGPIAQRWLQGEEDVVQKMARVRELGVLGAKALEIGDWDSLALYMEENQAITTSLGGSGEAIDRLISDAKACGAKAAKLAGAGLGGTVIALTLDAEQLECKLKERGYTHFMRPSVEPGIRFEETA